jgi:hypothetical protein
MNEKQQPEYSRRLFILRDFAEVSPIPAFLSFAKPLLGFVADAQAVIRRGPLEEAWRLSTVIHFSMMRAETAPTIRAKATATATTVTTATTR